MGWTNFIKYNIDHPDEINHGRGIWYCNSQPIKNEPVLHKASVVVLPQVPQLNAPNITPLNAYYFYINNLIIKQQYHCYLLPG